jgi:hypothetical protein
MHRLIIIDAKTRDQIEDLARLTGKPEEKVVAEVLETELKSYKKTRPSAAKALLELADYAEKIGAKGPKDLSTHHDTYLYDE